MSTTLSELGRGKTAKISSIVGGFGLRRRISTLGIRAGKIVKVVSSQPFKGPIVVDVDDMRIAIGRGMADKVIVEEQ